MEASESSRMTLAFCEVRAASRLAAVLWSREDVKFVQVSAQSLALFADASWIVDRAVLFKTYAVLLNGEDASLSQKNFTFNLYPVPIPSDPSDPLLCHMFSTFENASLAPLALSKDVYVMAMETGSHLGSSSSVRLSPIRIEEQLETIALNLSLYRLGCVQDRKTALSTSLLDVSDKFYNIMRIRPKGSEEPLPVALKRVVRLIQRNLFLLGLYPLPGNSHNFHALLSYFGIHEGTRSIEFDDFWFNGIVCNTTILGMTEFVSEFGPFDHISLQKLEDRSVILPSLITALFKTIFIMQQNLAFLGFSPKSVANEASMAGPLSPDATTASDRGDWNDFEQCVRAFQQAHGIQVSGVLGPVSRRKLTVLVREAKSSGGGAFPLRPSQRGGGGLNAPPGMVSSGRDESDRDGGPDLGAAVQRGMDRLRTLGVGENKVDGASPASGRKRKQIQVEDVTIDMFVQYAKAVEETKRAAAAKLEKKKKKMEQRNPVGSMRAISPVRKPNAPIPSKSLRPSVSGALSTSEQSHGSVNSPSDLLQSHNSPSLSLRQRASGLHVTSYKDGPPSPNHLFPKQPNAKLSPVTSRSASPGASPLPLSGDEGVESDTNPPIPEESSAPRITQKKILRGIKNIGRNVKRLATLGGTNGIRRQSFENLLDVQEQSGVRMRMSPVPQENDDLNVVPVIIDERGAMGRQRSLSVDNLTNLSADRASSPESTNLREASPNLRRSVSESGLHTLLFAKDKAGSRQSSMQSNEAEEAIALRENARHSVSITSVNTARSKNRISKASFRTKSGRKSRTKSVQKAAVPLPNQPLIQVPESLFASKDVPKIANVIETGVAELHKHPRIGTTINTMSASALSNPLLPAVQQMDAMCFQIDRMMKSTTSELDTSSSELSIAQLNKSLADIQEALQAGIVSRKEHKQQLIANLKLLAAAQVKASIALDNLSTQASKIKYAVGLLEGRVSETEEASKAFAGRIDAIENKLRKSGGSSGGWFGWWK